MASRIKGITIEIDGNTKPLETALKNVNSDLAKTQSSLKDVDSLLKLDPENTELLSQKQRLLQEAIEGTEKKLTSLKEASEQAKSQLEAGTLGQDKYDSLQREILSTENKLSDLQTKAREVDSTLKNSSGGLTSFANSAESMSTKLSGVSKASAGLAGGIAAAVPATQELRRDLSFLYENAKLAGVGMNDTERAFKTFNAVSGETDSSVEAVSNLLQAGFTKSNLQTAVEGLAGAASRFPDTLKIEGLADGLQETLATGKAIGPFAELLDRLGIGADNFSEGLAKCTTEAEKQEYALKTMADAGLMKSYEGWRKNNKELAEYEDSTIEMQMAISDLAKSASPLVSALAKIATEGLEGINKMPPALKGTAAGIIGITAAASPAASAAGKIAKGLDLIKGKSENTTKATGIMSSVSKKAFDVIKMHPYTAAAAGAAALGVAIYKVVQAQREETKAAEEMSKENEKNIINIEAQSKKTEFYAGKLEELSQKENKTAQDKQTIQAYVDRLNESIEGLNLTYDAESDKLSKTTNEIYKKIDAMKQEAIHAAYIEQSKNALDKYAESQIKLVDAQERMKTAQEAYDNAAESGYVSQKLSTDLAQAKADYKDLEGATASYWQEYTEQSNRAFIASGQWDDLIEEAGLTGKQIPENLTKGIESGLITIPTTVQELNDLINFNKAVNDAGMQGTEISQTLAAQISNGEISVKEATNELTNAVDGQLEGGVINTANKGAASSSAYASGILSGKTNVTSAGSTIGQAASTAAAAADFYSAGYNDGAGYANGLRGAIRLAADAGIAIADAALSAAKKASQQHSPSKKWAASARMDIKGYLNEMRRQIPAVEKMGSEIANAAITGALAGNLKAPKMQIENMDAIKHSAVQKFDYNQIYNAMRAAVSGMEFKIVLDQREIGRGLKGMGVQFK